MNAIRVVVFFLSFLSHCDVHAAIKGSNTLASVESNYTFPEDVSIFGDNEIRGFAWFKNGFSLENSDTDLIFNAVFPVSGTINLNGGRLHLQEDLILRNVIQIDGLGTIYGNNHILDLCTIPALPTGLTTFNTIKIELHQDLILTDTLLIQGDCTINAFGKIIDLQNDGKIIVDSNAHLAICDAELRGVRGENVSCADDSGRLTLDNVLWIQDDTTEFKKGSILFKDKVEFVGSSTFSYSSMQTSTIGVSSRFLISSDMHLCLGRHPDTLQEPLAFEDATSCLHLDNCSFVITDSGICFTKGTLAVEREVLFDIMGTTTSTGLIMGDGSADNDLTVWFMPGAAATHNSGYWVYNNSRKDLLKSSSKTSRMIRNLNSKIYLPKSLELNDITVQLKSNLVAPIEVDSSAQLSYMGAAVSLPDIDFDITSDQLNAYTYCLNGEDSLFLSKGVLPLYLVAMGVGNQVRGNGGLAGMITLLDNNAQLTCGINGYIDNLVTLNEGEFILGYDLLMRSNAAFVGPGKVNLGNNKIDFMSGLSVDTPIYWEGDRGTLIFNGKVTLSQTWTIKGSCRIVGNDAKLVFADGGNIVLEADASLTFKSIPVFGLKNENIRCLDDTGKITFLQSEIHLADDFVFQKGSCNWYLYNCISGAYTFSYDSTQNSIIKQDATLEINEGATLALNKHQVEPISFENEAATLKIIDANLLVGDTGCHVTKGAIVLDGKVNFDMQGTTTQTGFITGDGSGENDVAVYLLPGVEVSHNSGYWVYNNASPNQLKASSHTSRLVRQLGSQLYMPQNITVDGFTIELVSPYIAPIEVGTGKLVSYNNAHVRLPDIDFDITANQLNAYTYNLDGNDSVFITKGTLPLYLLIQNVGNQLFGNGGVSGGITLYDADAQLFCGINGFINNFIALNNGELTLTNNVILDTNASLIGPGIIDVATNEMFLPPKEFLANTPIYWKGNGGGLKLIHKVTLSTTWTINGKCVLRGVGAELVLAEGAEIVINDDSELILKNLRVSGLSQENIHCTNDTGVLTLINADLVQSDDFRFTKGHMELLLHNTISGAYTFSYDSNQTSTIKSDGKLLIKDGIVFAIGRNEQVEPLYFQDKTATLEMQDCTLYVKETGMQILRGNVVADRDVVVDIMGNTEQTGLIFGDGTPVNDPRLVLNPGVTPRFPSGYVTYDITDPYGIRSKTKTASLIRGPGHFHLKQHLILADLTVDVDAYSTLTVDEGKILSYANGRIIIDQGTFDLQGIRYNDYTTLLGGSGKITLVNGALPLVTLIAGTGNSIEGNGNVTGPIILSNAASELTFNMSGCLYGNVLLGGGKVTLSNDIDLANNVLFSGNGIVQTGAYNIDLGKADIIWPGDVFWDMDGGAIGLHAKLDLQGTWTIKGTGEIKGHGQTISLNTGRLVIDQGSQLTLSDVQIEGLNCSHLKCLGDDSVLILDNVSINQQDDHVAFSKGALRFKNKVTMYGSGIFSYETNQTSTICADSQLAFDTNMTFSYCPTSQDKTLVELENNTSKLILNNASLCTTVSGIQLTKGQCIIKGNCAIRSDYVETENIDGIINMIQEGVIFGAGNLNDDCTVVITGGSTFTLKQGKLSYQNVSPSSLVMENSSSMFTFVPKSTFEFFYDMSLGIGKLIMDEKTLLQSINNAEIIGSVFVEESS